SSVQRVHGFWRFTLRGTVPTGQASCLIVGGVGATCHLAKAFLARDPRLAIELASRWSAEIAYGDVDHPVWNLQGREDAFLDREDALVLLAARVRLDEAEHLDLVELVNAKDAACVLARRAGLAPEAGRVAGVPLGQIAGVHDLVGVQRGERDLG